MAGGDARGALRRPDRCRDAFPPHRKSIHAKHQGDALNVAFASYLDSLVRSPVALWIHEHSHESCNPREYLPMELNPVFDPVPAVDA
jgi:hypothetical protein